jgi:hypothetical protein
LSGVKRCLPAIALSAVALAACSGGKPDAAPRVEAHPAAPRQDVDPGGGTGKRGPGNLFNACERIWCLAHERNFDLAHFESGHVGWILHDDGSGDVFVPKHRTSGPEFPDARVNVLALCGRHLHPYWLGRRPGPLTKSGYNVALGYDRAHFRAYGTRLTPCCVNAEAWGFLHAAAPREYRFGDRQMTAEMAGSGWQKAFVARSP